MTDANPEAVDVAVVGAGPVGLACAIECLRCDLSVRVFDKGAVVNSLIGYPTNMEFFSTPDLLEIGGHPFPTRGYKPIREEAIDYYRRVASAEHIDVHLYDPVSEIAGSDGDFTIRSARGSVLSRKAVVATGFFDRPNLMDVEGESLPKVTHYYKEPFAFSGQRVAVIGAKNSAAKAALECYRHGADVTMIVRESSISESVKYWIKPDLENRISEGAIKAFFRAEIIRIETGAVVVRTPAGTMSLRNDWVLAMTGYLPDYELLDRFGIEFGDDDARTPVYDTDTFETNRAGVYIAGTVCGGLNTSRWFIENGRDHARIIATHIAARRDTAGS